MLHGIPYCFDVCAEVLVGQKIAHAAHFLPGQAGGFLDCVFGDMAGCFADDLEVADDGVDGDAAGMEAVVVHSAGVGLDFLDGVENVLDAEAPVSRRHVPFPSGFVP